MVSGRCFLEQCHPGGSALTAMRSIGDWHGSKRQDCVSSAAQTRKRDYSYHFKSRALIPRVVRFRDAPRYLRTDRNPSTVRSRCFLTEVPIGQTRYRLRSLFFFFFGQKYLARNGRPAWKGANTMGRKRVPDLITRAGIWHIDKPIFGRRVCQSTGTDQLEEAERTPRESDGTDATGFRSTASGLLEPSSRPRRSLCSRTIQAYHRRRRKPSQGPVALEEVHSLLIGSIAASFSHESTSRRARSRGCGNDQPRPSNCPSHNGIAAGKWVD